MLTVRTSALIAATLSVIAPALADNDASEARIRNCLCKGMQMEVDLPSGARADCVSDTHVIEIDPTRKWAEAIGQSLHYSEETGKPAMIFLYCEGDETTANCQKHSLRLESTVRHFKLHIDVREFDEAEVLTSCSQ